MHARVMTFQYQLGKVDEAVQFVQESVLPEVKQEAGFCGLMLLVDRSTHKAVGIVLYQTQAHVQAAGASNQARLARDNSILAAAPHVEFYEVALQE